MNTKCFVQGMEKATAKNGKPFFKLTVITQEKNQIQLYLWSDLERFESQAEETRIFNMSFDQNSQFPEVQSFFPTDGKPADFVQSAFPSEEYARKLMTQLISSVKDEELNNILNTVFSGDILDRFLKYPAAHGFHHALPGGLLLHTFEVASFVSAISKQTPFIEHLNKDMAMAGAILHDVGKLDDYITDGFTTEYSTFISVQSHLSKGAELLGRLFDPNNAKVAHLQHIIRSHHLLPEWGAINKPATLEATLVAYADNYSATFDKITRMAEFNEDGLARLKGQQFVDFEKAFANHKVI